MLKPWSGLDKTASAQTYFERVITFSTNTDQGRIKTGFQNTFVVLRYFCKGSILQCALFRFGNVVCTKKISESERYNPFFWQPSKTGNLERRPSFLDIYIIQNGYPFTRVGKILLKTFEYELTTDAVRTSARRFSQRILCQRASYRSSRNSAMSDDEIINSKANNAENTRS